MEKQRWEESERRRKEVRRSEKKEDAGARKGRKVAIHCVFPMICGSGGSKSRLAIAAGAGVVSTSMLLEPPLYLEVGLRLYDNWDLWWIYHDLSILSNHLGFFPATITTPEGPEGRLRWQFPACTTMSAPVRHSCVFTSPEGVVMLTWRDVMALLGNGLIMGEWWVENGYGYGIMA